MTRRRKAVLLAFIFLFLAAFFLILCTVRKTEGTDVYELSDGYIYSSEMSDTLKKMKEEQTNVAFWQERKDALVFNPEFNRSISTTVLGIAGDTSVLFPDQNVLSFGEDNCCLLGANAAVRLFGSTQVNGKRVEINGRSYAVAGIIYDKEDVVIYELSVKDSESLDHAGYRYRDKKERNRKRHALESGFGIVAD